MIRLLICLVTIGATQMAFSQIKFGVNVKAGVGEMEKVPDHHSFQYPNEIESAPAPTWGFGIYASKELGRLFTVSAELGYNKITGLENETFYIYDIDYMVRYKYESETVRNAHYVSLPISLDLKIAPRVSIGVGVSANYLIADKRYSELRINDVLNGIIGGGNDLNKFDLGIHTQANIQLSEKFALSGKASWGMINTRPTGLGDAFSTYLNFPDPEDFAAKNRQFTIGLTYFFTSPK
ncbi:MAG: outer membrane beta-barrel protein [Crocinitomix sp.]|nr:outer membrane beta-barrel protein [Crocinitomix sp.]